LKHKTGRFLLVIVAVGVIATLARAERTVIRLETTFGNITIELFTDEAPNTVENLLDYIRDDFYDGLIFHRAISDFVIQTGAYDPNLYDPNPDNDPNFFLNPSWSRDPRFFHTPNAPINGESSNGLRNLRGTLAMALSGTDENSGTSQFFINIIDNGFLDFDDPVAPPFTVFGRVLEGLEVADMIAEHSTVDIGDSFPLENVPDPNMPAIINDVDILFVYDPNSGDFDDHDFIQANDGDIRTYVGQGQFLQKRFTQTYESETVLGVRTLRIDQSEVEEFGRESFSLNLARNREGEIQVFHYAIADEPIVDPNSLLGIVPFLDLANEDMTLRLLAGDFDSNDPNDPRHIIQVTENGLTVTQEIVGFSESLASFPEFDEELVLVRTTSSDSPNQADWSWFHSSLGLVLDLDGNAPSAEAINFSGNGWRFSIPNLLTELVINFRAGKSRDARKDAFEINGLFDMPLNDFLNSSLVTFLGPFESEPIQTSLFKSSRNNTLFTHRAANTGIGALVFKFDFDAGTFSMMAKKVNLTGLGDPIRFEMATNNYFGAGEAVIANNRLLPLPFRLGHENILRVENFRVISSNVNGFGQVRFVRLRGAIATAIYPIDLSGREIQVGWGTSTFTIPAGQLRRPNANRNLFTFRGSTSLANARIDLDQAKISVDLRGQGLSSLANVPQDFSIDFEVQDDPNMPPVISFSETVEDVGVGNVPSDSTD
jgi:cyclophilin family peptidyl-prolyl cis-trans isomerase